MAFDLHEAGVAIMRAKLRRDNPGLSASGIEDLLVEWLTDRPGAPDGDATCHAVAWPRSPR